MWQCVWLSWRLYLHQQPLSYQSEDASVTCLCKHHLVWLRHSPPMWIHWVCLVIEVPCSTLLPVAWTTPRSPAVSHLFVAMTPWSRKDPRWLFAETLKSYQEELWCALLGRIYCKPDAKLKYRFLQKLSSEQELQLDSACNWDISRNSQLAQFFHYT